MEGLVSDNESDAIVIGAHFSGNLRNSDAESFLDNFSAFGQPVFYVNNDNILANSSNYTAKRGDVQNTVVMNAQLSPLANTGMNAFKNDNEIKVDVATTFFQNTSGDYHVSLLVLEHAVQDFQQGQGNNAIHPYVLRKSFTSDVYGESVASGNIMSGTSFQNSYTIDIDAEWDVDRLYIVALVWEKKGNSYTFINGSTTNNFGLITSVENPTDLAKTMTVNPSIGRNFIVQWNESSNAQVDITVINTQGQVVLKAEQIDSRDRLNTYTFSWEVPGLYTVLLQGRAASDQSTNRCKVIQQKRLLGKSSHNLT